MPIDKSQSLSVAGTAGLRAVGLIDARTLRTAAGARDNASPAGGTATPAATFQPTEALDPGQPPVDADRVALIRKAIETGAYPIIPAKIADAMIAAGLLLRASA
ncbi:MAG TPA: flagellar biosynthesis anti-sigma factor FlgM [Novosphingobium sp.]|nr:flagellar biosynthesis anti-sigma factor FlgM [Novosphingobium sp.]